MPVTRASKYKASSPDVIVISDDDADERPEPCSHLVELRAMKVELKVLRKELKQKQAGSSRVTPQAPVDNGHASLLAKKQEITMLKQQLSTTQTRAENLTRTLEHEKINHRTSVHKLKQSICEVQAESDAIVNAKKELLVSNTSLKKSVDRLRAENAVLKSEVERLKARMAKESSMENKAFGDLEDLICCDVCQETIWHPYLIVECGHTACLTCLTDWFTSTQRAHNPLSCPKCRTAVHEPPIQNFALKDVVRGVVKVVNLSSASNANGNAALESPPRKGVLGPFFRFIGV
ncbi:hypothetical protein M422DRAFT_32593 [Sphaerobolus stellatus SS14]|uniref:E3 ubiquitin protein ligase n=1 Tax=Sphaerobolus stellatus (strain SS14) TaxID=990650 RepID=A0A0C9U900_SPHS4|nr:hypothetical protein M422DRAFT_32593 [Sphaerobolus stellatus SS14]